MQNESPATTLERLRQLIDTYGASPDRWPQGERAAALELLMRSAEARKWHDAAARLDRLFDLVPPVEPSPELKARVLAAASTARERLRDGVEPVPQMGPPAIAAASKKMRSLRKQVWVFGMAALPLAAAAILALWLMGPEPPSTEQSRQAIPERGVYETSTETTGAVLLAYFDEPSAGRDEEFLPVEYTALAELAE